LTLVPAALFQTYFGRRFAIFAGAAHPLCIHHFTEVVFGFGTIGGGGRPRLVAVAIAILWHIICAGELARAAAVLRSGRSVLHTAAIHEIVSPQTELARIADNPLTMQSGRAAAVVAAAR
jgi:hypothetical protein